MNTIDDWKNNVVIYQILIDRFAGYNPKKEWKKNQFVGGNIKGIIDSLPYLKNLGITTLWISPFYKTSAYHGYHITDFFEVEPRFGSKLDLQRLIDLAHQNEMTIIADFVPNHVSKYHPYFLDAQQNKNSDYSNWFYFTDWPNEYQCFLSVKDLPKLNLQHETARRHVIDAALYWLSLGLDGFRLDHVIGPSNDFWKSFKTEIKSKYPNTVLIGEAWMQGISWSELKTIRIPWKRLKWLRNPASDSILRNYVTILDGVLDFSAQRLFQKQVCVHQHAEQQVKQSIMNHYEKFPNSFLLPSFLDNHDMDRFLFQCHNDISLLQKAATVQFSLPQPCIIYYGTELGLTQSKSVWSKASHGDLLARKPMPWNQTRKSNELYKFYKKIILKRTGK